MRCLKEKKTWENTIGRNKIGRVELSFTTKINGFRPKSLTGRCENECEITGGEMIVSGSQVVTENFVYTTGGFLDFTPFLIEKQKHD